MPAPIPSVRLLSARLAAGDKAAAREIAAALRDAEGHHGRAAELLGCGTATLYRWLDLPVFRGVRLVRLQRGEKTGEVSRG